MDRFSIPNIEVPSGNESLADVFTPTATRVIPKLEALVLPRVGTGVTLVARRNNRRTAIAATAASLACVATLLALYAM
jgi:hypothetical protein